MNTNAACLVQSAEHNEGTALDKALNTGHVVENLNQRITMTSSQTNEKLMGDLASAAEDAEDLLEETADQVGERTREVRQRLTAALERAKLATQKLQEKTVEAAKATDRTIREHPYQSIGIAFGVGVLLGVLISRR